MKFALKFGLGNLIFRGRWHVTIAIILSACGSEQQTPPEDQLLTKLSYHDSLAQQLLNRNRILARTLDSLVVDEINRRYTPEIQNQILQNTTLMDEYRRWVEESEEALSRHSAATAALKQEVADVKARIEPFVARQAPTREWLPEIEATMKLWQNHVAGARDAEQKIDVWIHDYKLWLDKVSQIYAAADTLNMP